MQWLGWLNLCVHVKDWDERKMCLARKGPGDRQAMLGRDDRAEKNHTVRTPALATLPWQEGREWSSKKLSSCRTSTAASESRDHGTDAFQLPPYRSVIPISGPSMSEHPLTKPFLEAFLSASTCVYLFLSSFIPFIFLHGLWRCLPQETGSAHGHRLRNSGESSKSHLLTSTSQGQILNWVLDKYNV